jgi:hypothetical protein
MRPGQRDGVPAIGLDPLARPHQNEEWRCDRAAVAEIGDPSVQAVAARVHLIDYVQPAAPRGQPLDQAPRGLGPAGDHALEADLTRASQLGHRHCRRRLARVQPAAYGPVLVHTTLP